MTFGRILNRGLSIVTAVGLLVMMLHTVGNAISRAVADAPIPNSNEIVAYWYLPFVSLLGIVAAQLQNENITVTLAVERMSLRTASYFRALACFLVGAVSVGFAWFGFEEAVDNMKVGATAGYTDVIAWPVYFLVPLTFAVLAILCVLELILIVRTGRPDIDLMTGRPRNERNEDHAVEGASL